METVTRAARALFLDQGFSATSMDAIARTAGVSKATVYAYFPNKEALFASLIMAECEGLEHDLPLPNLSEGLYPALQQFARQYARVPTSLTETNRACVYRKLKLGRSDYKVRQGSDLR
jgi:AcrR family transcriptional regulator